MGEKAIEEDEERVWMGQYGSKEIYVNLINGKRH